VFVTGLLMIGLALAGAFFAIFDPVEGARWGGIGVFLGCGAGGLTLAYLDAPSRRDRPKPGMERAKATVLDGTVLEGSVAGYQMVELTLDYARSEAEGRHALPGEAEVLGGEARPGRARPLDRRRL
jgi:hypothetical protein